MPWPQKKCRPIEACLSRGRQFFKLAGIITIRLRGCTRLRRMHDICGRRAGGGRPPCRGAVWHGPTWGPRRLRHLLCRHGRPAHGTEMFAAVKLRTTVRAKHKSPPLALPARGRQNKFAGFIIMYITVACKAKYALPAALAAFGCRFALFARMRADLPGCARLRAEDANQKISLFKPKRGKSACFFPLCFAVVSDTIPIRQSRDAA